MNKKFSTLVATLLASGGLFYAVDAMILPANDGVARTYVTTRTGSDAAQSTEKILSCNLKNVDAFKTAWTLVDASSDTPSVTDGDGGQEAAKSYNLQVAGAEGWFLCENGIQYVGKTETQEAEGNETAIPLVITLGEEGAVNLYIAEEGGSFTVKTAEVATVALQEDGANILSANAFLYTDESTPYTEPEEVNLNVLSSAESNVALVTINKSEDGADTQSDEVTFDIIVDVEIVKSELAENAPGADVPGMGDVAVSVAKDGAITVNSDVTAIPAPTTVAIGGKTLSVQNGKVVYLTEDDAKKADSWVLVDSKYKNVTLEKLGETKIWLQATAGLKSTGAAPFVLVEKAKASTFTLKQDGSATVVTGESSVNISSVALKTTGVSTAIVIDDANKDILLTSVASGDVVLLGNGTQFAGTDGSRDKATLWVVSKTATTTDGTYRYSFKEKDGDTYFTAGDETEFTAEDYKGSFALKATNGQYVSIVANGTSSLVGDQTSSALFSIPSEEKAFTAKQILSDFGTLTSFNLSLWDEKDGVSILVQNPFEDADLVPVYYNSTDKTFTPITANTGDANQNESTFLLKKGNSYIVVETTKDSEWSNINSELIAGGYKFVTLSEKAMAEVMKNGEWKDGTYAPYFTFNFDANKVANGEATAKTPIYSIQVSDYSKTSVGDVSTFTIKTGAQAGTYLTTSSKQAYWAYAEFSANNAVRGDSDKDYNPLNMKYVNITFVNHSSVTSNKIKLNGKVLGAEAKPADAANFLFDKPEGQWAVQMTAATGDLSKGQALGDNVYGFTFVNRENNDAKYVVSKMYYLGNNKYAVAYSGATKPFATGSEGSLLRDTIAITPVETALKNNAVQRDGYKNLTAEEVQDQLFNLLVASSEEDYYVGENHTAKSHFLGLSHDENATVNWRIVPLTAARAYDSDKELTQASDSVYVFNHPQYYKASDKKFYEYKDTVAIISYALQNVANDEFLTYENPQTTDILSMICDPAFKSYKTTKNISEAYRFVLKEKGTDLYNIVGVTYPKYDAKGFVADGKTTHASLNLGNKLYGATTLTKQGAVEVEGAYDQINSNDLFKVQKVGAPEYRLQSMGDTIRIFRQENDYDQMFENGEFLNIGNKAQLTTMAPALYVDTAYVKRGNNNRYQYLLAVNPEYKPATFDNANHQLTPDTTYGRFLVNLIDTAYVAYVNGAIHTNKYINDNEAGEHFAKLGFVYGFRTGDKLYITDKNYTKSGKASDVIDLSTSDFNTAKFAFRYINPINHESDGSFKVQTGYYDYNTYIAGKKQPELSNDGYLKNINGVVVVAKGYAAGDKFDLAAEHSNPTANDEISASAISVVATDGAVIVKGAEGKNVVITNVLGQTIANTVITSSEATIAAPAGVVVVAVEGEAAVKAIVK